jgi:hypothetical protein
VPASAGPARFHMKPVLILIAFPDIALYFPNLFFGVSK